MAQSRGIVSRRKKTVPKNALTKNKSRPRLDELRIIRKITCPLGRFSEPIFSQHAPLVDFQSRFSPTTPPWSIFRADFLPIHPLGRFSEPIFPKQGAGAHTRRIMLAFENMVRIVEISFHRRIYISDVLLFLHSLQVTIKTNLLAELKHQAPN